MIFPDRATLYMVGIEDREYKEDKVECKRSSPYSFLARIRFDAGWSSVYGYNMGCLKNYVMREPLVDTVDKRQICTDHVPLKVQAVRIACPSHVCRLDVRFENHDGRRHRHAGGVSSASATR